MKAELVYEDGENGRLWQDYVEGHTDATVYHLLAWRNIFGKSFGYRSWYLLAKNSSNGRVAGCAPLFLVNSLLSPRLVSVPFRDRGGPLWDCPEAFHALLHEAKCIAKKNGARFIELKSLCAYPQALVQEEGLQEQKYWIRSTVSLQNLDEERLWTSVGDKTRNMVRQAEQAQLAFDDVTRDERGFSMWYALHLLTQKRLGLPPFPEIFFKTMMQELVKTNTIKIFLVRKEHTPLAACILFLHRKMCIYAYSASDGAEKTVRPNDFMLFNIIKWLLQNDYHEFDMGSDAPSQKGLLFFKRKWLAKQEPLPVYTFGKSTRSVSDSSAPRYALLRKGFQYLPTGVLRMLGSVMTRHFG